MDIINSLQITDTAYGGYGVGRSPSGQVILTPFTVEGDIADIKIVDDKKSFAYGELVKIIEPSPLRAIPECPHVGKCGGCLFGHINYTAQRDIKLRIIKNALRKYPHMDSMPEISMHTSPTEGYRIRATVRARQGVVGFFGFKTNDFIPVENCRIIKPSLFEKIKTFAATNEITGEIQALETPDGIALAAVKADSKFKNKFPFDGVKYNGKAHGLKHAGFNTAFGAVGIGYGSFFQSNGFLLDEFQKQAISLVREGLSVAELYAGGGFFTAGLVAGGREVRGVEWDEEAIRLASIYGYPVEKGGADGFLDKVPTADCVFMDPPRDGVSNKVIAGIKRLSPLSIVYVSCNPATLARDILKLSDEYIIKDFAFFDMFPDTYHTESVVRLEKIGGGGETLRSY